MIAGRFGGLLVILWLCLFALWQRLLYTRSGAAIIYAAKDKLQQEGRVFPSGIPAASRLLIFGNSKVLSGFVPSVFDANVPGVFSVNMGKPDETHFVKDIEVLARHAQLPQKILLTVPWSGQPRFLAADDEFVNGLFPFRKMPRDLILFTALAHRRGGMAAFYLYGKQAAHQMEQDRGWYFIEGQSHYPNHRLPDPFRLETDTPFKVDDPAFIPRGPEFEKLNALAERYRIQVYLVPSYYRTGEMAPLPENAVPIARQMRGWPRFHPTGPAYFLFPNRYFSDPVHLNPEGASFYTRQLAAIMPRDAF